MAFSLEVLRAPFPPEAISWRAQSVSKKNPAEPKAMALAYIDARDVMNRLDDVCGPENWEDAFFETPKGRLLCTLKLRINGEWIGKTDGAGDTDVEGEKGAISDSLKRAAVKWGIGRYLYDMPTPWVRCELYNEKWSKWTDDGQRELERILRKHSPQATSLPSPVIDDAQWALLTGLIDVTGTDAQAMCEHYKIPSFKQMTVNQFEDAKARLEARQPRKAA